MPTLRDRNAAAAPLTRDQLLEAPLVQLYGCTLGMVCHEGCTRPGHLEVKQVATKYGHRHQLRRVLARLRCKGCKRPPAEVAISSRQTEHTAGWSIVLKP
jgi:hypothetical protein